jgi:hypothetical protein
MGSPAGYVAVFGVCLWFCRTVLVFGGSFDRLSAGLSLKAGRVGKPNDCHGGGNEQSLHCILRGDAEPMIV